jgi:hypothetical protein
MNSCFDHIEQIRYLLSQIFTSGFVTGRDVSAALSEGEKMALELGMPGGADLLRRLDSTFTAFAAGQGSLSSVVAAYCNAVSYYNMTADMLVVETIAIKSK